MIRAFTRLAILAIIVLWPSAAFAQSVALAPSLHRQFLDGSGKPLAGGFLYSYASGTNTRLDTFTDSTGTIANSWPIPLDSTGAPSNGSTQTGIFLSNNTYKFCALNSAMVQQWCIDGISAYQILNGLQNVTFGGVTSDPTGAAGEIGYRSDLGCLREYTSFWACLLTDTGIQTLTNKTLTSPAITNPTITGGGSWTGSPSLTNPAINGVNAQVGTSYTIAATDEQKLITFTNASPVAVTLPQATTTGFGAGTVFHIRNLAAGLVTITPTTSTIDGVASLSLAANQGIDIYSDGNNYETQKGSGFAVNGFDSTGNTANIPATTLITPAANGFYRFSCYTIDTQAATTSSQLPACNFTFTDPDTNHVASFTPCGGAITTNTVGDTCQLYTGSGLIDPAYFMAKAGVAIKYQTTGYASVGATPMAYAVHFRLEGPF
jgi:hypothetical protein